MTFSANYVSKVSKKGTPYNAFEIEITPNFKKLVFLTQAEQILVEQVVSSSSDMIFSANYVSKVSKKGTPYNAFEIEITPNFKKLVFLTQAEQILVEQVVASSSDN